MRRIASVVIVAALVRGRGVGVSLHPERWQCSKYRLARVERGPLTATVSATGNLNAVVIVQVGSQVSGQIKELLVDFNSIVKKNEVVARIDRTSSTPRSSRHRRRGLRPRDRAEPASPGRACPGRRREREGRARGGQAFTAKARVQSLDAKRDYDRKTELFDRLLIAKSDLDTSQATYDAAVAQLDSTRAREQALSSAIQSAVAQLRVVEAALDSARAQVKQKDAALRQAQVDLDHTTIRAPVDGVVVSRQVDVGRR